jgi:hypothetical protein
MRRSIEIVGGVVVLLVAGAALMTGCLSSRRTPGAGPVGVERQDETIMATAEKMDIAYAEEMPDTSPDVGGLFVRREGSNLYIGTGNVSATLVEGDQGETSRWYFRHDGPVAEVITTQDTLIYRDDTMRQFEDGPPSGPVQQMLSRSTLEEIDKDSMISVWVEMRDNRMVARVIVFSRVM